MCKRHCVSSSSSNYNVGNTMSRPIHLGMVEQTHTCGDLRDGYDIVFPTLFWVYHINPI